MNAPAAGPASQYRTVREGSVLLGILSPGVLLGGVPVLPLAKRRPALLAIGLCGAVLASVLLRAGWLAPGWELVLLIASMGLAHFHSAGTHGILGALLVEVLYGPLWMCGLSYGLGSIPISSALPTGRRHQFRVIQMEHPPGAIRLGIDMDRLRAVDIPLDRLPQGMVLIGTTGAGKTWTIDRLLDGVIANGGSALVLDGKGPSLATDMQSLGVTRSVPVYPIDPDDPSTFSYDPLQGAPASVMNKLIGALVGDVSGDAAIYRQLAMSALPATVEALRRADRLSLRELARLLSDGPAMAAFARSDADSELRYISERMARDRTMASALSGMSGRIGSALAGTFGPILSGSGTRFAWALLDQPSIAYVSLSTLGSVADSALMARIMLADAQQWVARRMKVVRRDPQLPLAVIVIEEITAVTSVDPEIEVLLQNLLLQARSARTATIVTGQTLPVSPVFRQAVLGAGTMIAMRVTAEDSEVIAGEMGTVESVSHTWQTLDSSPTGTGSARMAHSYKIHPQELRSQQTGCAVLHQATHQPIRVRIAASSASVAPRFSVLALLRRFFQARGGAPRA